VVGLVIVSHSARLAEGVVELAREMGGDVPMEAAGGMAEPEGALGTDAERVRAAIEATRGEDGVLVLMDLGSALMSAELATEMLEGDGGEVRLVGAPLVEGAVAAAVAAQGGASLDEVAAEARGALRPKAEQLGEGDGDAAPEPEPAASEAVDGPELRLAVGLRLGLHARPAARFVETVGRFGAEVSVRNATTGSGPTRARSLAGLQTLGVRQGHEIVVTAAGEDAEEALEAIEALAAENFGDPPEDEAPAPRAPAATPDAAPARGAPEAAPAPPASGAVLQGIAASPGLAIGPARLLGGPDLVAPEREVDDPRAEWARVDEARAAVRRDLDAARDETARRAGAEQAGIFGAQLLLLDDEALLDPARAAVLEERRDGVTAVLRAGEGVAARYRALEDPYLRERATDVLDVAQRLAAHLAGRDGDPALAQPGVVVADELTPGDAVALDPELVQGVATARGAATAHAAILARSLGLPAVVGLGPAVLALAEGTPLALDGDAGTLRVDPPAAELAAERERGEVRAAKRARARERAHEPAVTRDGTRIEVMANLGAPSEAPGAVAQGAEGVGLLRTEFLFLEREALPDEEEQLAAYVEIAGALEGRPLIVRTLDVGADKPLPALPQPPEANPFLGRRGLRLSLAEPELLRTQLRAVLRAAAEHPVKVMFPMVATLGEVAAAKEVLAQERERLGSDAPLEVGAMVEVPALALRAGFFAAELDFLSIGTNDLAQYTMAAERGNAPLAALVDGPQPALLDLVARTVAGAREHGRWVGVCGELAGDPAAAALLVGLGVTELSMAPALVPEIKATLRELDLGAARAAAERALGARDADEARALAAALL